MPSALPDLPPKPQPPEGYDCCGGGCADCEIRLYIQALKEWRRQVDAIEAAAAAANEGESP